MKPFKAFSLLGNRLVLFRNSLKVKAIYITKLETRVDQYPTGKYKAAVHKQL